MEVNKKDYIYHPPKYKWEDMTGQFQADLVESEEMIDKENVLAALEKEGKQSLFADLTSKEGREGFVNLANSFDARLIGVINEWAEAVQKSSDNSFDRNAADIAYARDGITLDGKTSSTYMWEKGISFPDVIMQVQAQLDQTDKNWFKDIGISIGGPAFMTSENVLESVKQFGQIHMEGSEKRSNLKNFDPYLSDEKFQDLNRKKLLMEEYPELITQLQEEFEFNKSAFDKENLNKKNLNKEDLNKENLNKENLNKENLNKENLNKEDLDKKDLDKNSLNKKEKISLNSLEEEDELDRTKPESIRDKKLAKYKNKENKALKTEKNTGSKINSIDPSKNNKGPGKK